MIYQKDCKAITIQKHFLTGIKLLTLLDILIRLWHTFLKKNELAQQALPDVVTTLRTVLAPALLRAALLTEQTR